MTPERWQRLQEVFGDAVELGAGPAREAFLARACAGDAALRAQIEEMLALDAADDSLLDATPTDLADAVRPEEPERPAQPTVGPYRIVREIGRGGMGAVYLAEREDVGKRVALKLVRGGLAAPENHERFLRERRVLARLEHPNIALLLDAGTSEDGTPFFAMEYVQGQPIDRYCDERRLPIEARLALFEEVCEAVEYAHRQRIVHRDLKPSNILVTEPAAAEGSAQVKLLDFGIAKVLEEELSLGELTGTGMRLMTPDFAAPEQIRGEEIRPVTDVYALGILLYRLLTGYSPYRVRGHSLGELERLVLEQEPPRPSTAVTSQKQVAAVTAAGEPVTVETVSANRSTVPERLRRQLAGDLDSIVLKALEKAPERRYRSAGELLEDLRRYRAGLPVRARSATARYRARKWVARNRIAVAAACVLCLATLIGVWRVSATGSAALAADRVVVLPFDFRGSQEHEYLREGMVSLLGAGINASGNLHTVDTRALFSYLGPTGEGAVADPAGVARHFGAQWYVRGEVVEENRRLRIALSLHRIGGWGRSRRSAEVRVQGPADSLVVMLDRLTDDLLSGWTGHGVNRLAHSAALSTGSLEAMRLYLEGEREMRAGRYAEAMRSYQQAVIEDTTFALGYYRLSVAASWLDGLRAARARSQAVRWSPGLPRPDSMLILASWEHEHGQPLEAERLYRQVLERRQDDVEAWYQLGEVLYHWGPTLGRPPTGAWDAFERVLHFEPGNFSALLHLARLAGSEGRLALLDSLAARALRQAPDEQRAREVRALVAYAGDDPRERAKLVRELSAVGDNQLYPLVRNVAASVPNPHVTLELASLMQAPIRGRTVRDAGAVIEAQILAAAGRVEAAATGLATHTAPDARWATEYRAMLATLPFLPVTDGELRRLRVEVERLPSQPAEVTVHSLLTIYPSLIYPPSRLFLLGLLELRLGNEAATLAHADHLDALDRAEQVVAADLALLLRAFVAHGRGDAQRALAMLGPPRPAEERRFPVLLSYPKAYERWLRAELLRELGREEEALLWYATFPDPSVHDLMFVAPARLRRAEIHERRGEREQAVEHYRRFLDLWRDADPELQPRVGEALRRLAELDRVRAG